MANLLRRNDFGGIDRVCYHPDRDMDNILYGNCMGCTSRAKCNEAIFERLVKYEESGFEPDEIKRIVSRCIVVEVCPECGSENEFVWDTSVLGYEAHCPVCGSPMLLCDECTHAEDELNKNCRRCDWHETENGNSSCFRCKKKED